MDPFENVGPPAKPSGEHRRALFRILRRGIPRDSRVAEVSKTFSSFWGENKNSEPCEHVEQLTSLRTHYDPPRLAHCGSGFAAPWYSQLAAQACRRCAARPRLTRNLIRLDQTGRLVFLYNPGVVFRFHVPVRTRAYRKSARPACHTIRNHSEQSQQFQMKKKH